MAKSIDVAAQEQFSAELEGIVSGANPPKAATAVGSSLWGHVQELLQAIKSGNVWTIWEAVTSLIKHLKGDEDPVPMEASAKAVGVDWTKLFEFARKVLAFILPLL